VKEAKLWPAQKELLMTSSKITAREQRLPRPGIRSLIDRGATRSRPWPKANRCDHRAYDQGSNRLCDEA
jgi:hypothetical protein